MLPTPPARRLCHVHPDHGAAGSPPHAVAAWLATVPPGTRGTAAELLPGLLASHTSSMAPQTPAALGAALARLGVPRTLRSGVSTWALAPCPLALPWH
jgi:hypothetical protein